MNKHRSRKSGRYTGAQVRDPVAEAQAYYQKHKKSLDKIIPNINGVSKEKIFIDKFKFGISGGYRVTTRSNSKESFRTKVEYVKAELQGYNLDALTAKKTAYGGEAYGFGDKRKLSLKRFDLRQELKPFYREFGNPTDSDWEAIDGYFEIANSDVVIARVFSNNEFAEDSPTAHFEFFRRQELGI